MLGDEDYCKNPNQINFNFQFYLKKFTIFIQH